MNLELARPAPHVIPNPQRGEEFSVYNRERFLKIRTIRVKYLVNSLKSQRPSVNKKSGSGKNRNRLKKFLFSLFIAQLRRQHHGGLAHII